MTLHPLVLSIHAVDLVAFLLVIAASVQATRVVAGWRPGSSERAQLNLERGIETASLQGRLATGLFVFSTLLHVVAVASVLPPLVPGAMCGTGVEQAMGDAGTRALVLRLAAVGALALWWLLDGLDRAAPLSPLAPGTSRAMLVAAPLVTLACGHTLIALAGIEQHDPVSCCAMVYDAAALGASGERSPLPPTTWVLALVTALALLGGASRQAALRHAAPGWTGATALLAVVWAPLAAAMLVRHLAAYHYGVLAHHCPWCLFLPEHHLVGYPLYGALAVVLLEGPAGFVAHLVAGRGEGLVTAATARGRSAGIRLIIAVMVFGVFAVGPALAWRIQHGVWMR